MNNACKILLFSILLVVSIALGIKISQFISHQPTDFNNVNETALGENVRNVKDYYDLLGSVNYQGIVLSVEKLGLPPVTARHSNSGQRLKITIKSVDGTILIIDDFYSGKHAEAEIESMAGQEFPIPTKLWRMRSSIMFD